jgi:putative membrane protein insertion efficiency factor
MIWTIRGYQKMISRYTPPVCRFHPSCSKYTVQAVNEYGILRGFVMGSWRILRCNPLFSGGYDPVPRRNGGKLNE